MLRRDGVAHCAGVCVLCSTPRSVLSYQQVLQLKFPLCEASVVALMLQVYIVSLSWII